MGHQSIKGPVMIEWERVNELRAEIGDDDFEEVVAMFLEEADEVIARTSPETCARDLEANLHFLKGAALNLGFTEFAMLCQVGERRAADGQVDVNFAQVVQCYFASKKALEIGQQRTDAA